MRRISANNQMRFLRLFSILLLLALVPLARGQTLEVLHSFDDLDPSDSAAPHAGLLQAQDGDFYGTASGTLSANDGIVFKITTNGLFTKLIEFTYAENGDDPNGDDPFAGLAQAGD